MTHAPIDADDTNRHVFPEAIQNPARRRGGELFKIQQEDGEEMAPTTKTRKGRKGMSVWDKNTMNDMVKQGLCVCVCERVNE